MPLSGEGIALKSALDQYQTSVPLSGVGLALKSSLPLSGVALALQITFGPVSTISATEWIRACIEINFGPSISATE